MGITHARGLRVLGIIGSVILACGVLAVSAQAADPVTLKIGITEAASDAGLNPYLGTSGTDYEMYVDQYDLLTEFDTTDLHAVGGLAQTWDVSDDGLTWTYHIRPGVTFQDGTPYTAEDARFQLQYIIDSHDPKYKGPAAPDGNDTDGDGEADNPLTLFDSYLDLDNGIDQMRISSITATDDATLVITTTEPLVTLDQLYIPMTAKHIWENITFASASTDNLTLDQAVGTGPFRVTSFDAKQLITLDAFKGYWGGAPKIDKLIYQLFENDEAQVNALKSGDVQLLDNFPPGLISTLQNDPNITLHIGRSSDFAELGFNSWDPTTPKRFKNEGCKDCDKGPTTGSMGNPWLTKPEVRGALAGLIDKKALIQQALLGYGEPGTSVVSPLNPLYAYTPPPGDPDTFPDYTDDASQQAARQQANERFTTFMAGLGFTDTDGNGILNAPNTPEAQAFDPKGAGKDWNLRLFVRQDDEEDKSAGQLMEQWFKDAGVNIDYREVSMDPQLYDATYPNASNADYDLYIWGWGPDPDPNFILSIFACNQINGWQDANYCDATYDEMYKQQRTLVDKDARAALIKQMEDKAYHDSPYSVLWYTGTLQAYRNDAFEGFTSVPGTDGDIWSSYGFGPYGSRISVAAAGTTVATPAPSEAPPSGAPASENPATPAPSGTAAAGSPVAGSPAAGSPAAGSPPAATPAPSAPPGATPAASKPPAATPAPSPSGAGGTSSGGGNNTILIVGGAAVLVGAVGVFWYMRRNRDEDDDE